MIHEIGAGKYDNTYKTLEISDNDTVMLFENNKILCSFNADSVKFPKYFEVKDTSELVNYTYLFEVSGEKYFLAEADESIKSKNICGYAFENNQQLREMYPKEKVFAAITSYHLYEWYRNTVFCGRCGTRLKPDDKERMMKCPKCGNMIYPRISPGIIVGITDGDKILLTKYAGREYKKYALVAGFCEIGESLEDTVHREVMEEVGLKVKNLKFYKSQPWAYSQTLLCGFFAELDGDSNIILEEDELSEGTWVSRDELEVLDEDFSLTNEMMVRFKNNKI